MAKKYLDDNGVIYLWSKIKAAFAGKSEAIKSITRSGTTFTATRADDTTFTFTQQDNTVAKTTTTPKAPGTAAIGSETQYAAGDHVHPEQTSVSGNAGTATTLETPRTIDGVRFNGSAAIMHYGSCSTAAATVAKVVSCTGFSLVQGAWIAVKFTVTNTGSAGSLTLNVNSTGAKSIKYRGGTLPVSSTLAAGRTYLFVYDGTNYELVGDLDTGEVNQYAFSNVKVGNTTIAAETKTDTLELATSTGGGIVLTPDATNDKVTIDMAFPIEGSAGNYYLKDGDASVLLLSSVNTSTLTQNEVDTGTGTTGKLVTAQVLRNSIDSAVAAASAGATAFKGMVNQASDISGLSAYTAGWYWVVQTAGTYAGQVCEVGDMVFAIANRGSSTQNSDFSVVQNNLDLAAITNAEIDTIVAS